MKRAVLITAVIALTLAVMVAPAFASHGGGHHRGSYSRQSTVYRAPDIGKTVAAAQAAAAVCEVKDCTVIGEHSHSGGKVVTHYYGDGHDYHGEYDHYYGDGHDYHEQYDHYYGDGHEYHDRYDHYYGDGHSYHTQNGHAYHAGERHH